MSLMYNTKKFSDFWDSADAFYNDVNDNFPMFVNIAENSIKLTYYLLFGRYGNSPISNMDENQFKVKLYSLMFQYGQVWEKKLAIQGKLHDLNLDEGELFDGSKAIHNHAFNPETEPSTTDIDELPFINDQNTSGIKKSKMDAYLQLWRLLDADVTTDYLNRFSVCFKQFAGPERPLLYVTEED